MQERKVGNWCRHDSQFGLQTIWRNSVQYRLRKAFICVFNIFNPGNYFANRPAGLKLHPIICVKMGSHTIFGVNVGPGSCAWSKEIKKLQFSGAKLLEVFGVGAHFPGGLRSNPKIDIGSHFNPRDWVWASWGKKHFFRQVQVRICLD